MKPGTIRFYRTISSERVKPQLLAPVSLWCLLANCIQQSLIAGYLVSKVFNKVFIIFEEFVSQTYYAQNVAQHCNVATNMVALY